jgi:hypothetical protein
MSDTVTAFLERMKNKNLSSAAQVGVGALRPPTISIKGNDFLAIVGDSETKIADHDKKIGLFIDIIVADMNPSLSKIYYAGEYDPKATEYTAPDCWSDNGVGPSATALRPQSETCAACPMNVWGSSINKQTGKSSKACNDARKLAVILADDPQGQVYLLRIPPASLKNLATYGKLLDHNGDQLNFVITRVYFESQGVLAFERVDYITEAHVPTLQRSEDKWAWIVGSDDKPRQGALPAPEKVAQIAGPKPSLPADPNRQADVQTAEAETEKRRRRTKAEMEAARAAEEAPKVVPIQRDTAPLADDEIPAFLGRRGTTGFGMTTPTPADSGMSAALTAALGLKTK